MDETNLLSLIRSWLDTNCQITTKFATISFCKKILHLNRPVAVSSRGRPYSGADPAVALQAPCVLAGAALASGSWRLRCSCPLPPSVFHRGPLIVPGCVVVQCSCSPELCLGLFRLPAVGYSKEYFKALEYEYRVKIVALGTLKRYFILSLTLYLE
jgi:hypothetical protein